MRSVIKFTGFLQKILPSPFSIAVLLTYLTFVLALWLTPVKHPGDIHLLELAGFWAKGFWELLGFSMQMMLILVLGYVLALTRPVNRLIEKVTEAADTMPKAAFLLTLLTVFFSFINWGLGLIFGAVFARKLGEHFSEKQRLVNYPLLGAAGYAGLMVWHGGLSGSAPLKVAEKGHFLVQQMGVVPLNETVFSHMNLLVGFSLLIVLPLVMWWAAKKNPGKKIVLKKIVKAQTRVAEEKPQGAERLDRSRFFSLLLGLTFLGTSVYLALKAGNFSFVNLNYINFALFTLGILLTPNVSVFQEYVVKSIQAAAGILIQFPLYAGIMGLMKYSGLFLVFTHAFVQVSTAVTLPVYTLFSAGLVNFFVPSGGGQWAVQGPVIVEAAKQLGVSMPKIVMALAYGDQWTNMLQPFWALPLLGITGLKAREIVPYTFLLFLCGGVIFVLGLLFF